MVTCHYEVSLVFISFYSKLLLQSKNEREKGIKEEEIELGAKEERGRETAEISMNICTLNVFLPLSSTISLRAMYPAGMQKNWSLWVNAVKRNI